MLMLTYLEMGGGQSRQGKQPPELTRRIAAHHEEVLYNFWLVEMQDIGGRA